MCPLARATMFGAVLAATALCILPTTMVAAADREATADAAATDLGRSLREALGAAMKEGGPTAAVQVCHEQAPGIAREVAERHGVMIGRVGTRLRNPGNAPEGWQQAMLAAFERRAAAGEAPETLRHAEVAPGSGALRYGRGIRTEAACQLCHGTDMSPAIAEAIATRYPQDRATGYAEGELRGAFWVEVPAATP
jgi:hypothetical protein